MAGTALAAVILTRLVLADAYVAYRDLGVTDEPGCWLAKPEDARDTARRAATWGVCGLLIAVSARLLIGHGLNWSHEADQVIVGVGMAIALAHVLRGGFRTLNSDDLMGGLKPWEARAVGDARRLPRHRHPGPAVDRRDRSPTACTVV